MMIFDQQIKKIVYSNCDVDGHHSEPLSRVCTDDKCKDKTLVCSLCEDIHHNGHRTVPLKVVLSKINHDLDYHKAGINPLYFTNIIDQSRSNYFSLLSDKRHEINGILNELDNIGKLYFNKIEQTALGLLQAENPFKFLNQNDTRNAKSLREYFRKMLKMLNYDDKNGFSLEHKLKTIVADCKSNQKKIKDSFSLLVKDFERSSQKISASLDWKMLFSSAQNTTFDWSQEYKGAKIKITGVLAEQTGMESSGQRFAMLQPNLSENGLKKMGWGFKVKKFSSWIGVGMCLRNSIKKANYHFNYTNIGHGSYLISSNGYSWSHSVKEFNSQLKAFQFMVGDIVYIEYDPIDNKLRFRKNTGNDKFELTVVPPPLGDCYCPCVNLCSTGDSVQLVTPGMALS